MEAVVLKGPLIDQIKLSCVLTIIMNPLPRVDSPIPSIGVFVSVCYYVV